MKLFHYCVILIVWIVVFVNGQRQSGVATQRHVTARTTDDVPQVKPLTSRGKTRFSLTPEYQQTINDNSRLSSQIVSSTRNIDRSSYKSNSPSRSRHNERSKPSKSSTTEYSIPSRRTDEIRNIQFVTPVPSKSQPALYEVKEVLDDIPKQYKEQYHYSKKNIELAAQNEALTSAQRIYQQSYTRKPNYQETNENILRAARNRNPTSRRRSKLVDPITEENRPQETIQASRVKPQISNVVEPRTNLRTNNAKLDEKNRVIEVTENEPDISYADFLLNSQQKTTVPREGNYVPSGPGTFFSLEESIKKENIHSRAGRKIHSATEPSRGPSRNGLKLNPKLSYDSAENLPSKEWVAQDLRTPKGRGNKKGTDIITVRKKAKSLDTDTINVVSVRGRERLAITDLPELISQMRRGNSEPKPRSNRRMDNFEAVQFVDKDVELENIMPLMNMDLQKSDVDTASSTRTETRVRPSVQTPDKSSYTIHPRHTRSTTEGVVEKTENTQRRSRTRASSRNNQEQISSPTPRNSRQRQSSRRTSAESDSKLEQSPPKESNIRSSRNREVKTTATTNTRTANQRNSRNFESSEINEPASPRTTNYRVSKITEVNESRRPTNSRRTNQRNSQNQDLNDANVSINTRNVNRKTSRRFDTSDVNSSNNNRATNHRGSKNHDVGRNEVTNSRTFQNQRPLKSSERTTEKSTLLDENSNNAENIPSLNKPKDSDLLLSSTEKVEKAIQVTESINSDRKTGKTEENTAVDKAPLNEEIQPTKPLNEIVPLKEKTKTNPLENVDPSPLPPESLKKSTKPLDLMELQSSEKIKTESVVENVESPPSAQGNYRKRKPTSAPDVDHISTYSPRRSFSNRNNNVRTPETVVEPTKSPRSSRRGTAKLSTTEISFTKRETSRNRGNNRTSAKSKNKEDDLEDDDISESDNYPEPFKALIQKKKKLTDNNYVGVSSSNVSVISTHHEEHRGLATPRFSEKVTTIASSSTIATVTARSSSSSSSAQTNHDRQRSKQAAKSISSTTPLPRANIIDNELEYQITTSTPLSTPRSASKSRRPTKSSAEDTDLKISVVPQNHRFGKTTSSEKVKTKSVAYKQQSHHNIPDINNNIVDSSAKVHAPNSRQPNVVEDNIIPVLVSKSNTHKQYKTTAPSNDFQISPTPRVLYKGEITTQNVPSRKSNYAQKTRNLSKPTVQNVAVVPPTAGSKRKYSSRSNYNYTTDIPQSLAKPTPHKFSARYRTEFVRHGNLRPSNAPIYTPTVPVISSTTSSRQIKNDITRSNFHENELDILTVIPPVSRKLYSASLISENLLNKTSSTEKITIITPESSTAVPDSTIKLSTWQPSVTTTTEHVTTTTQITTTTTENYSTARKTFPTTTSNFPTTTTNVPTTTTTNFPTTTTTNSPTTTTTYFPTTTQISIKPDKRTIPIDPFASLNRISTTPEITTYQYTKIQRPITTTLKTTEVTETTLRLTKTSPVITTHKPKIPVTTTNKPFVSQTVTFRTVPTTYVPTERLVYSTKASKKKSAVRMTPATEKSSTPTSRKYLMISTTTKRPQTTTTVKNPKTNQINNADLGPSSFLTSLLSNLFNNPTISTKLPETTRSYSTVSVKPNIASSTPSLVSTRQNTKRQNIRNNNTKNKPKTNTTQSTTHKSTSTVKTQNARNVKSQSKPTKPQNTTTRKPSTTTTTKKQTTSATKTTRRTTTTKRTPKLPVTTPNILSNQIDDFSDVFDSTTPRSGLFPNLRSSILSAIGALLLGNSTKPTQSISSVSLLLPPVNLTSTSPPAIATTTEKLTTTTKATTTTTIATTTTTKATTTTTKVTTPVNPPIELINTNTISNSNDSPFEQLVATAKNSLNTIVDNNFVITPSPVQTSTTTTMSPTGTSYTTAVFPFTSTTQLMTPSPRPIPFPTAWAPPDYVPRFAQRPSIAPLGTYSSTTSTVKPDFVVFGILPNNTVVRKKPRSNTTPSPFIVFGIFPNNTIVRKFPNGTIIPDDSSDVEVTNLSPRNLKYSLRNGITITTTSTTTPAANNAITQSLPGDSIQDNLIETVRKVGPTSYLSPEVSASTHILSLTTTKSPPKVNSSQYSTTTTTTTGIPPFIPLDPKLPTLAEILGPRVVDAYKEIVNETQANRTAKYESSRSISDSNSLNNQFGNEQIKGSLLDTMDPIIRKPVQSFPVTASPVSQFRNTESFEELYSKDIRFTNAQSKPNIQSTESFYNLQNNPSERPRSQVMSSTTKTKVRSTTTIRTPTSSTTATSTTRRTTTTQRKPAKLPTVTTSTTTEPSNKPTTPSIADLLFSRNEQTITTKMTQIPIVQQTPADELAFLNSLREASKVITQKPSKEQQELANRIVALAVQKSAAKSSTTPRAPITDSSTNKFKKELDNNQLLEYLQKAGISPAEKATTYGKSNEAILAALLKERGIGPSTSQDSKELLQQLQLAALLDQIVVTPKPKTTRRTTPRPRTTTTTTQRPLAGIFQGVRNWLVGAFVGPEQLSQQSIRPTPALAVLVGRSRPNTRKTTTPPPFDDDIEDELFFNDPVKFKPTTSTTVKNLQTNTLPNVISENSKDLTQIRERPRSLQSNTKLEEVEQTTKSRTRPKGTTARRKPTTTTKTTTTTTTIDPFEVDEFEPEDEPPQRVRGQLVDAAINVTKAFSQFLGAAIQGAASTFQQFFNSGARSVGNYFSSASVG